MTEVTAEQIDALLPQTQCGDCSYKGCRPYAEAIAHGSESIDRCPPGGVETLMALGALLNIDPAPYVETVKNNTRQPSLVSIREEECIGCTKCIQACPVDAIVGAAKLMHTVITDECTGCNLCVAPCPVDCIDTIAVEQSSFDPQKSRQRFSDRLLRLQRLEKEKIAKQQKSAQLTESGSQQEELTAKKNYIEAILARAKAKKE